MPKGCRIGVGIDHGEHAGSQVAVLAAWNAQGIWILDETVSEASTTPTQDAHAIRRMLLENGLDVHLVDTWVGDVNSAGSVDLGEKLLNAGFLRRQVKVHPQCEAVIKGLRHARGGRADEDLKHALDAMRYVTYAPLTAMNSNRSTALRYQL